MYKKIDTDAFMFFYYESYDEIINNRKFDNTFNGLRLKIIFTENSNENYKKNIIKISMKNILETRIMKIKSGGTNGSIGHILLLEKDDDEFIKKWEKTKNKIENNILFIRNIEHEK